ncbi:uncharacterized protein LOC134225422 [Armigeres subalbatus]|uniref:uncharacterized protein LOC134225422 n=1 Tax=Armigeres subalbatus TaxID=124917 RepID=UPI002ED1FFA2
MDRSIQWFLRLAFGILCATSNIHLVSSLNCYSYQSSRCIVRNLQLYSSDLGSLKFPVYSHIELQQAGMDFLSPEIVLRMKWVSNLTITNGDIGKIYLKHDLLELIASNSKTFEIIIGEGNNTDLEKMVITGNELRGIPNNIESLKSLMTLKLSNNKIEFVDFEQVSQLEKVSHIDLANNRIYYIIPYEPFELSCLEFLDLSNNFMTEIEFTGWIVPRLRTLSISSNSLTFTKDFNEENFPSIERYTDNNNLFDCRWRAEFVSNLKQWKKSKIFNIPPQDCSKAVQLSSSTYRKLNMRDIRNYTFEFDNHDQLQKQINVMLDAEEKQTKRIETLNGVITQQTEQLKETAIKLLTQQAIIDKLLVQIENLQRKMDDVTPARKNVPKGSRDKLIQEIADVVWRNLSEDD